MANSAADYEILESTATFIDRWEHRLFIDGARRAARSGEFLETWNPSSGQVLGRLAAGGADDVEDAVQAARAAFEGVWRTWSPYQRQDLLMRVYRVMDENFEGLAQIESMDMGAPFARVLAGKASLLKMIQFFAGQACNIKGETVQNGLPGRINTLSLKAPVGVIGGIIPWNGPLNSQFWILGAALATGCTVVLKPAEEASLAVLRVVELLHEAGVPPGVVNVVTGRGAAAGHALAIHPGVDRIAFTGSTQTGRRIIEASTVNIKKMQLELGGKSANIIFSDADLEKAVPGAAMGVYANSGQICFAGTRVLVQRRIVDQFTDQLLSFTRTLRVGPSLGRSTDLGPVISQRQLTNVLSYMNTGTNEGAELIHGGNRLSGDFEDGYFVEPTIFANVRNDMRIAREEIFGPVLSVIPFDDEEEAIAIANDNDYGLAGGVWSRDIGTALRVVEGVHTGTMWVNCYGVIDPLLGFGGTKMSGYGAKGSAAHLDTYLYTKNVYIQI